MTYFFKIWKFTRVVPLVALLFFIQALPFLWVATAVFAVITPLALTVGGGVMNISRLYVRRCPDTLFGYLYLPTITAVVSIILMMVYYIGVPVSLEGKITDSSVEAFKNVLSTAYLITITIQVLVIGIFIDLFYRDHLK